MSKAACPYCYRRIDGNRLWFRCRGRGAPGMPPCPMDVDKTRRDETGFSEPTRPCFQASGGIRAPRQATCPRCRGVTGFRVCPNCHSPLPSDFGTTKSPLIAMVGAMGTGKTVYLTVLAHELRSKIFRRFGADIRYAGDMEGGHEAPQWLREHEESIYKQHELFLRTEQAVNGRREPLVFEWRQERHVGWMKRLRTSFLSFYDTAGEDLLSLRSAIDLTYLGAADALILLLDPFMLPHTRDRIHLPESALTSRESTVDVVNRVTKTLRPTHGTRTSDKIKIPVAVAFAKLDALFDLLGPNHPLIEVPPAPPYHDDESTARTHEHIKTLLYELGADDIDLHLRYNYETFRYFGVSSLGAQPDYDTGTIHAGGVRPHRVDEPLVWLLGQWDVVPSRDRR